jgi:putative ABC transport system permease protein
VGDHHDDLAELTCALALAMLIAVLGVINTLMLSVLERTRELRVMRALGLSRAAIARMITVESVVICSARCRESPPAPAWGRAVVRGWRPDGLTQLSFPWALMAGYLVAALLVGVVAAVVPAIRASRVNVLQAIAHE